MRLMLLIIILENKENRKGWKITTRPPIHTPIHIIKNFGIFVSAGKIGVFGNLPGTNWIKYKILKWTPFGICFADSLRGINMGYTNSQIPYHANCYSRRHVCVYFWEKNTEKRILYIPRVNSHFTSITNGLI